jgi:hypothetical protein
MAFGTLENLAHSAFVPTCLADAERICQNLLALLAAPYSVLDPTRRMLWYAEHRPYVA